MDSVLAWKSRCDSRLRPDTVNYSKSTSSEHWGHQYNGLEPACPSKLHMSFAQSDLSRHTKPRVFSLSNVSLHMLFPTTQKSFPCFVLWFTPAHAPRYNLHEGSETCELQPTILIYPVLTFILQHCNDWSVGLNLPQNRSPLQSGMYLNHLCDGTHATFYLKNNM